MHILFRIAPAESLLLVTRFLIYPSEPVAGCWSISMGPALVDPKEKMGEGDGRKTRRRRHKNEKEKEKEKGQGEGEGEREGAEG